MQLLHINSSRNKPIHLLEIIGNASVGGMENYIKNFLIHLSAEKVSSYLHMSL